MESKLTTRFVKICIQAIYKKQFNPEFNVS